MRGFRKNGVRPCLTTVCPFSNTHSPSQICAPSSRPGSADRSSYRTGLSHNKFRMHVSATPSAEQQHDRVLLAGRLHPVQRSQTRANPDSPKKLAKDRPKVTRYARLRRRWAGSLVRVTGQDGREDWGLVHVEVRGGQPTRLCSKDRRRPPACFVSIRPTMNSFSVVPAQAGIQIR
jgi:hypothetical protein